MSVGCSPLMPSRDFVQSRIMQMYLLLQKVNLQLSELDLQIQQINSGSTFLSTFIWSGKDQRTWLIQGGDQHVSCWTTVPKFCLRRSKKYRMFMMYPMNHHEFYIRVKSRLVVNKEVFSPIRWLDSQTPFPATLRYENIRCVFDFWCEALNLLIAQKASKGQGKYVIKTRLSHTGHKNILNNSRINMYMWSICKIQDKSTLQFHEPSSVWSIISDKNTHGVLVLPIGSNIESLWHLYLPYDKQFYDPMTQPHANLQCEFY